MDKYDTNAIIQSAHEKLERNGDLEGGSMVFQSALLEWVDDAREGTTTVDSEGLAEAIATLWLAYAQFFATAKQFKSATEAYEQAVSCPVAKCVGRVWLEYARFLEHRNKLKSAQDVFIRALVGTNAPVQDEQDQQLLWNEFLEMVKQSNPDLTLTALQEAVTKSSDALVVAPEAVVSSITTFTDNQDYSPAMKRARTEPTNNTMMAATVVETRTHVVTADAVDAEATMFLEYLQQPSPEVSAAWMLRDGNGPAQQPETFLFQPSPPKLSDPTGKDALGTELALQLIRRLMEASGSIVLEVCAGLWTLQGLKEKETKIAIDMLDQTMMSEYEQLEARLDERLSVAGAALSAVQTMNDGERRAFQTTCAQQRQNVLSGIAWEHRQLLCAQQQILTKLAVPGFDGPTVDTVALERQAKVCLYLHSAFYLRNRIGEAPHLSMLKNQAARLENEAQRSRSNSPHLVVVTDMNHMHPVPSVGPDMSYMPPAQLPPYPMGGMQQQQPIYGSYTGAAPQQQMLMGMQQGYHQQPPPMMQQPTLQQQHVAYGAPPLPPQYQYY